MDNLDGYLDNLAVAATTRDKFLWQLVDMNAKQQVQMDDLGDEI